MELVVPIAGLAAVWAVGLLNIRQVRRLLAEMRVLLTAHLRRLERMQNAMAHGVSAVHRSLERMRRDAAEGAGLALLPRGSREVTPDPRKACHQHARVMLWATSRSKGYRRRSTTSSGGGRRRKG